MWHINSLIILALFLSLFFSFDWKPHFPGILFSRWVFRCVMTLPTWWSSCKPSIVSPRWCGWTTSYFWISGPGTTSRRARPNPSRLARTTFVSPLWSDRVLKLLSARFSILFFLHKVFCAWTFGILVWCCFIFNNLIILCYAVSQHYDSSGGHNPEKINFYKKKLILKNAMFPSTNI